MVLNESKPNNAGRHLSTLTRLLRGLLTVMFVVLAMKAVNWTEMASAFHQAPLSGVLGAALVYSVLQCLSATRWWCIAQVSGMRFAWVDAVAAFYTGMFFNLFLPGLVGGDAVRALLVARKTNASAASSFGIVYADRTVGFIAMLLVGVWGATVLHLSHRRLVWMPLFLGAVFAFSVTGLLVLGGWMFSRWHKGRWGERIGRFAKSIVGFLMRPQTFLLVFSIALAYHLTLMANLMMLGRMSGIQSQAFSAYAIVVAASTAIGSLPISLHGLGVRELVSIKLWSLLGVPAEQALLWALLWRVMAYFVSLPGGLVYLAWADRTVWRDLQAMTSSLARSR